MVVCKYVNDTSHLGVVICRHFLLVDGVQESCIINDRIFHQGDL